MTAWGTSTVGDEFSVQLGKRVDAAVARGVPKLCINNRGVRWGYINPSVAAVELLNEADIRALRLIEGDLLVCEGGEIGRSSVWRGELSEAYYLNTLHRLRPKQGYEPELAAAFFEYFVATGALQAIVGKSSLAHLTKENLLRVPMPVPPSAEQKAIATVLRSADDLRASLERLIAKKRDVQRGMMHELLTGRTRLPGFTRDWRQVLLGDHVTYIRTVALSRDQLDQKSPLRYLHYGDIHTRSSVRLDASTESMPRTAAHLASSAGRLLPGDLVFADASEDPDGVGRSVEISDVPPEGVVPGLHTIAARFDKSILADGFKAYIQFMPAFRGALLRLAAGTKVLATTRNYVSSIALTLPGTEEQRAIADALQDADAEIEALGRRLEAARAMKVGLMQELLTGRTRLPVKEQE
ncbi:type I restriction enzyme S subunit [Rathayibacter sp. PhB127]|uniref:restriction endonuclease subunit S n=1 Tax=Rathayibacter sp. PhB127 TaxID=2485176 RepID=UPI000F4CB910|nr:restriction endonuclease subunit S [Rathayibacter sp. PhB127]ROS29234.1 type I restriction enzyme S subunit [Rathayibacter sp. PhB127]